MIVSIYLSALDDPTPSFLCVPRRTSEGLDPDGPPDITNGLSGLHKYHTDETGSTIKPQRVAKLGIKRNEKDICTDNRLKIIQFSLSAVTIENQTTFASKDSVFFYFVMSRPVVSLKKRT